MALADKVRIALEKLQGLPEETKKIIIWTIAIILALIMGFFWITNVLISVQRSSEVIGNAPIPQIELPTLDIIPSQESLNQNATPEK
jgi:hypothetical protein